MRSSFVSEKSKVALVCVACNRVIQAPKEEANLLLLGARVLIDCPNCKTRFAAEPSQIVTPLETA